MFSEMICYLMLLLLLLHFVIFKKIFQKLRKSQNLFELTRYFVCFLTINITQWLTERLVQVGSVKVFVSWVLF